MVLYFIKIRLFVEDIVVFIYNLYITKNPILPKTDNIGYILIHITSIFVYDNSEILAFYDITILI